TRLSPGLSISADTPRLQALLDASFDYYKYAFAPDQDRHFLSLFGSGLVIAVPDTLFVDLKSSISTASLTGGIGFAPVQQQPANQTTQVFSSSLSPYLRKSYDGLVDGELRYSFFMINSGGGGLGPVISSQNTQNTQNRLSD